MRCRTLIQYVCLLMTTFALLAVWADDFLGTMFVLMFCWLFIPALIISAVSFVCSIKCNTRHKRILLAGHAVNILIFAVLQPGADSRCDAYAMEEHYEEYGGRMDELYHSLYRRLRPGCGIDIEFEHGAVTIFHVMDENGEWNRCWNPDRQKTDSLLWQAGLDRSWLNDIRQELEKIHCISIEVCAIPAQPFTVGFRRVGFGMYSYRIYPEALPSDRQKELGDECRFIVYSPRVLFEYGSGAIGSDCFPGKEEYGKGKAD